MTIPVTYTKLKRQDWLPLWARWRSFVKTVVGYDPSWVVNGRWSIVNGESHLLLLASTIRTFAHTHIRTLNDLPCSWNYWQLIILIVSDWRNDRHSGIFVYLKVRHNANLSATMKFNFNWKHALFHFLALWFFGHAFMVLALLDNLDVAETVRHSTNEKEILTAVSLSKLTVSMALGFVIGYLVALVIAFIVSSRIKGTWINTLVAFILFFILIQVNLTFWSYLKEIFLFLGSLFDGWLSYAINGTLLIVFGLFFTFGIRLFYNTNKPDRSSYSPHNA